MLFRETLTDELNRKTAEFEKFLFEYSADADAFLRAVSEIGGLHVDGVRTALSASENAGCIPADEFSGGLVVPFEKRWNNHEEARRWAAEMLDGRTTFAADGSQIYCGKETNVPVAAVQIGWFENPHDLEAQYEKY